MSANEKIAQDKLPFCKHCLTLNAGHFKNSATVAADEAVFLAFPGKLSPAHSGYMERLLIGLDSSYRFLQGTVLVPVQTETGQQELGEDYLAEY
jgi:hypothetical protein